MADTRGIATTNYGFQKPTVGGDEDSWGDDYTTGDPAVDPSPGLNGNWSKIDVLLQSLQDQIDAQRTRVNGLFMTTEVFADSNAVNAALGYGTWVAHAAGRALVGVGTSDSNTGYVWTVNQKRGNELHTLSWGEMPTHSHSADPPSQTFTTSSLNSDAVFSLRDNNDSNPIVYNAANRVSISTDTTERDRLDGSSTAIDGTKVTINLDHNHTVAVNLNSFNTGSSGSGDAHNNTQPSIGIYVWRRTA